MPSIGGSHWEALSLMHAAKRQAWILLSFFLSLQVRIVPRLLGSWAGEKYGGSGTIFVKVDALGLRVSALCAAKEALEASRQSKSLLKEQRKKQTMSASSGQERICMIHQHIVIIMVQLQNTIYLLSRKCVIKMNYLQGLND
eukprot:1149300-Pelagomonas_calceolata.AAC.6